MGGRLEDGTKDFDMAETTIKSQHPCGISFTENTVSEHIYRHLQHAKDCNWIKAGRLGTVVTQSIANGRTYNKPMIQVALRFMLSHPDRFPGFQYDPERGARLDPDWIFPEHCFGFGPPMPRHEYLECLENQVILPAIPALGIKESKLYPPRTYKSRCESQVESAVFGKAKETVTEVQPGGSHVVRISSSPHKKFPDLFYDPPVFPREYKRIGRNWFSHDGRMTRPPNCQCPLVVQKCLDDPPVCPDCGLIYERPFDAGSLFSS